MEAVLFDTMTFVDTLRYEGNMPENQAKAIAKAVGAALHQGVATHDDIADVKTLLGALNSRLTILESKMDGQKTSQEAKIDTGLSSLEAKMDGQKTSLEAKIDTGLSGLEAKLKIQQTWIYIIVGITALTNPVALHIYQAMGLK